MFLVEHFTKQKQIFYNQLKLLINMEKKALGRGLSALISSSAAFKIPQDVQNLEAQRVKEIDLTAATSRNEKLTKTNEDLISQFTVSIDLVEPNPDQPRQVFAEEELKELSDSIKAHGVLQPILVTKVKPQSAEATSKTASTQSNANAKYIIVAGERRWRASKLAGLKEVPVILKDLSEKETLEIALVENIQRQNLTPMEEAHAYEKLSSTFNLNQDEIAKVSGKNRATVANSLRLLKLPLQVQQMLDESKISLGHAKCILSVKEPKVQINLAKKVVEEVLSVRDLERIVAREVILPNKKVANAQEKSGSSTSSAFAELEEQLRTALGTKVFIKGDANGGGQIKIQYFSSEELNRVVDKICI